MHDELWNIVLALDLADLRARVQCDQIEDTQRIVITMLNCPYAVDLEGRAILRCPRQGDPLPAEFLEQLCILSYLIHAKDKPLAGKLVKPEKLEAGQFFFRGPHGLPLEPLEQAFGSDPSPMVQAAQQLGGRPCAFGDAAVEIPLFARVPVTFVVWVGDDEFPARASILFDETAADHLPLDALLAAVNLAVKSVTQRQ